MSVAIAGVNGACPCKPCQRHLSLTPSQRQRRKRMKIIDHYTEQMQMMAGKDGGAGSGPGRGDKGGSGGSKNGPGTKNGGTPPPKTGKGK